MPLARAAWSLYSRFAARIQRRLPEYSDREIQFTAIYLAGKFLDDLDDWPARVCKLFGVKLAHFEAIELAFLEESDWLTHRAVRRTLWGPGHRGPV